MNISRSISKKSEACCTFDNIYLNSNPLSSISLSPSQCNLEPSIGAISPWDEFWIKAKEAQIVDEHGHIRKEIIQKYPMEKLSVEEVQAIITILKTPINGRLDIAFTLLDYFLYLIDESSKQFNITITSINLIGGILPYVLKSYYIRNLNYIYKKQCEDLKSNSNRTWSMVL